METKILGLESSCDDTAVAIIDSSPRILANIVSDQHHIHQLYQGVVPEIAARAHLDNFEPAITKALTTADLDLTQIDAIAATCGPGLIGGVIVSTMYGKALASVLGKPFIAINHLEGHALTVGLTDNIEPPYLLLLISGGHCQFVAVKKLGSYQLLGATLDDSVGEAFDKVAKMLNIGFPGGPAIEKLAIGGDSQRFNFPRPLYHSNDANFSFSGLKTAVNLQIQKLGKLNQQDKQDVAASFQAAVTDILARKMQAAIQEYEKLALAKCVVIAGGVAANLQIRQKLDDLAANLGYNFVAPVPKLCTDNAAMIAYAGLKRFQANQLNSLNFKPRARWPLSELGAD